ncbi:MAG: diiron oxygenase [Betaproteobacteria bacterium]|nr:diiron oxygenase [Betaproteobacteria bacterium]
MQNADPALLRQLSGNSTPYRDPLAVIEWARLDTMSFWLPEPALSLYGLPEYTGLPVATRRRLSQYEFINVMQTGLGVERLFLQRISRSLGAALPRAEYEYFLHELREEAGHSLMFLKAIEASGLEVPAGAWDVTPWMERLARNLPARGALFWLATVIAEDVPDRFNRYVRNESEVLNPAIRQICTLHIVDEARHIAAARARLEAALKGRAARRFLLMPFMNLVFRKFVATFFLPPARFYELAGLSHGHWWRRMAAANPAHRRFIAQCLAPTLRMLEGYGLRPGL